MTQTQKDKIFEIIARIFLIEPYEVSDDSSQDTIENWDSVNQINLVTELEAELNTTFSDDEIISMISVKNICEIVDEKLKN